MSRKSRSKGSFGFSSNTVILFLFMEGFPWLFLGVSKNLAIFFHKVKPWTTVNMKHIVENVCIYARGRPAFICCAFRGASHWNIIIKNIICVRTARKGGWLSCYLMILSVINYTMSKRKSKLKRCGKKADLLRYYAIFLYRGWLKQRRIWRQNTNHSHQDWQPDPLA
jgi:hypothetical protein